ncbi:hypothetical protein [uncultured Bacteroides sp.]|uniref:hypothetical protein n=1 Tax=uncultured Bacteroides sp. TaxID=162156 RepID=UPI0026373AB8|nr:hypothetical protein [uncultured Bacteroides sp.]
MIGNGGIIVAPVTIDDIKQILGESSNTITTLCRSDKINKWSRVKPVSSDIVSDMSFDTDHSIGLTWGMKPPIAQASDGLNLNKLYINHSMGAAAYPDWVYEKVQEGKPCRMGDFKGYNPAAQTPFYMDVQNYTTSVNLFETNKIRLVMYSNLALGDFPTLGEFFKKFYSYYFVAEIYEYNSQIPFYGLENWNYKYKSETPLSSAGSELYIDVDVSMFNNKKIDVLMGMQKYESGQYQPQTGMMPPRSMTGYYRQISFFTLFNRNISNGYCAYSPSESISPWRASSTASSNQVSMNGYSNLYIKFDIDKKEVPMYIIGAGFNTNNLPANSKHVMFKVQTVGEGYNNNQTAVGTPIDTTTRQNMANGYTLVEGGSGVQTVGLNFANLIKAYGKIIYVMFFYSTDGGNTWSSNPMGYSMSINITRGT